MDPTLLVLVGPPGAGKSTLMQELTEIDHRIKPVIIYTTRPQRPGEKEKVTVSDVEIERKLKDGELVNINQVYGFKYGASKQMIEDHFSNKLHPIIDWKTSMVHQLKEIFKNIYVACVLPPSIETLRKRLSFDNRDPKGDRFIAAKEEITHIKCGKFNHLINLYITNEERRHRAAADEIYVNFISSKNMNSGEVCYLMKSGL